MNYLTKARQILSKILLFSFLVLPASTNYKLEGFSFGNAGGGQVGSSNYGIVGNMGELSANKIGSSNYDLGAGLAYIRQSSVPGVPTLVNNGNFYNKLHLIIDNTYLAGGSTAFPLTGILDNFNRTNGAIGSSWGGDASAYSISSNRLLNNTSTGFVSWSGNTFPADQEAYVTILDTGNTSAGSEINIVLKAETTAIDPGNCVEIYYNPDSNEVQLITETNYGWSTIASFSNQTLNVGDTFGGRFKADGTMSAYKNGVLIGSTLATGWANYDQGGYVGMWNYQVNGSIYDDFGGGAVSDSGNTTVAMPSDTKFAVAISGDNWATTKFVKSDMTVGGTLAMSDYLTYTLWGGASGVDIVGLDVGTTYRVKVKSMQGQYSESGYGAVATAATEMPTLAFDIDVAPTDVATTPPYLIDFGDLIPGNLSTSANKIWVSFETNATSGGSVFVYGQNAGLYSLSAGYTIPAVSGNLAVLSNGFGILAAGSTQASGGPLTVDSLYNGGGDVVGLTDTLVRQLLTTINPVTSGRASFLVKAKSSNDVAAASDYTETITIIGAANY